MLTYIWYRLRCEKGQGMVEYGLILALISIAAIAMMTPIGDAILAAFTKAKNALAPSS